MNKSDKKKNNRAHVENLIQNEMRKNRLFYDLHKIDVELILDMAFSRINSEMEIFQEMITEICDEEDENSYFVTLNSNNEEHMFMVKRCIKLHKNIQRFKNFYIENENFIKELELSIEQYKKDGLYKED